MSQPRPLFYQSQKFVHCQRLVECYSIVVDLNWSISPSDFMNWAAFLTNFGLVSISSQLILPNATFLLSPSHIRFLFWVYKRHSTSRCFADCKPRRVMFLTVVPTSNSCFWSVQLSVFSSNYSYKGVEVEMVIMVQTEIEVDLMKVNFNLVEQACGKGDR